MKAVTLFLTLVLVLFSQNVLAQEGEQEEATESHELEWTFENVPVGEIPQGWKVEGTNQRGPLATWQVVEEKDAPSGTHVLALTRPNHHFGGTFNLCWTDRIHFKDGEIEVHFKANSGVEDQGGGVIWRAKDKDNYYISRFNPLENNFRIYYVKDGARRMLASARIKLPAHTWHELKITHYGTKICGYLNGKKLLEVEDNTFPEAGGVGLWTKADAATSFDDFEVELRK
jgi:hypothetical protein